MCLEGEGLGGEMRFVGGNGGHSFLGYDGAGGEERAESVLLEETLCAFQVGQRLIVEIF